MSVSRRNFLYLAGASVAGAGASLKFSPEGATARVDSRFDSTRWESVREQFDLLARDRIHMSSFFLASHPRLVRDAIERHRAAIDANPFEYVEQNIYTMPGRIQAAVAEYLGGKPEEVAITNSTTMGLALIYHGLPIKAGQEILTTAHDHFVHHETIRLVAERSGATYRKVLLHNDLKTVSAGSIVDKIKRAITPKTRVLGVTWVHSSTGLKLPIRAIADAVAEANKGRAESDRLILVVDGVHGFGVEDVAAAELGADFFIAGTHKWMFGPRGTGIIWAKAENWKQMRMVFPAFGPETFSAWMKGVVPSAPAQASWIMQGGFHAFEYEWALPAAFEFHKQIGRDRVANRIHELNDQCKEGLASMNSVVLHTPRGNALSAGLIAFEVKGLTPDEAVKKLHAKGVIASKSPYAVQYVRLAPSLLNTPDEVESTLRAVRSLA